MRVDVCGVGFHKYPVGKDHVGKKFWSKDDEARQQFIIIVDEVGGGRGGLMFACLSKSNYMCLMTVISNMQ